MIKKYILLPLLLFVCLSLLNAQSGVIRGRVLKKSNYEPLPFVNIQVVGTKLGTASDMEGNFLITGLEPGIYTLQASFIGYETTYSDEIEVNPAKSPYIEITMRQKSLKMEEITVSPTKFERLEESPVSVQQIQVSDIEKMPGANRDISKVIESYPGVGNSVSFRNDIIVRGGGPSESVFYLEGIELPYLNHFATQGSSGGAVGIINADLIQSVNYFSGAFPASRGGALSGVFEFELKDGSKSQTNRRFTVGASEISYSMNGAIGDNVNYIVSLRRSYLQFLFNYIGLPFLPTFNDGLFKTEFDLNNNNKITLLGLGAYDKSRLNTGIGDPDEEQKYILNYLPEQDQQSYVLGMSYRHLSEKGFQKLTISRNMLNNESYKYQNNIDEPKNKLQDYQSQEIENNIKYNNTLRINEYKINFGSSIGQNKYNNETFQKRYLAKKADTIRYNTEFTFYDWATFGQISKSFFKNQLDLSLGVRFDANNYSDDMDNLLSQFSPRFSASYSLNEKMDLNFNTGKYYQLPPYTSLGFRNDKGILVNKQNNLKYITNNHFIIGTSYYPNLNSKLSIETFYKNYQDYPVSATDSISLANRGADFNVIGDEELLPIGKGRAYGLELSSRYTFFKNLESIFSYTLVKSEFTDATGDYIPSSWDIRHTLNLTMTKSFQSDWQAGFKLRYASGPPYTPYDLEKSALKKAWNARKQPYLDYSKYNTKRLNDFYQLDIRIDKRFYFSNWALTTYLDIQNLLNYQADQPDIIKPKEQRGEYIIQNPEAPQTQQKYGLKRIENDSGTVLPTIGIILDF